MKDVFFKGYVRTKNKECIEKYKNRTKFSSYEEIKDNPEFAGILDSDTILIDVDDPDESEILMNIVEALQLNCRVYQTTRGKHFVFWNRERKVTKCSTHSTSAIGIEIDVKVGCSNSYEVLKFGGKERFIEWDVEPGQDYQEVPKWLIPIKGSAEFVGMTAGDGRNQKLFNYILTLFNGNDFTMDETRETIKIINQYVLKEPLSDEELAVILRDAAFQKPSFFKGNTFLFEKFADYLIQQKHIKKINNQLYVYQDDVYRTGSEWLEYAMMQEIPNMTTAKRTEVLKCLNVKIRTNTEEAPPEMIAFRNGVLDISNDQLYPHSPDIIILNRINWDYNPYAYDELLDETLDKISCHNKELRMVLEEAAGYALFRKNELGKAFFLTGTGSNGKSTYLKILEYMLGEDNISNLDLKKLSDRFSTVMMFGKLANIGDDISDEFVIDTSIFKKIVTGERIDAEQKGQPKFEFNPYVKLYFSANNIPRMGKGKDWEAIERRMQIIPFNAKFSPDDPDFTPYISTKLKSQGSIEYMIRLAVEGLKRVMKNLKFTESALITDEIQDFKKSNNPVLLFVDEYEEKGKQVVNEPTQKVYDDYVGFCMTGGYKPMTKMEFSKAICKALGLRTEYRKTISAKIFLEKR